MKKKLAFKIFDVLFSYIVPIFLVAFKYDLFKTQSAGVKLTAIGVIVVIVLAIAFGRNITKAISNLKNTKVRKCFVVGKNLVIAFIIVLLLELSKNNIDNLIFLTIFLSVSISIGHCFREDFRELIEQDEKAQREKEMVEAFRKAQEEDK